MGYYGLASLQVFLGEYRTLLFNALGPQPLFTIALMLVSSLACAKLAFHALHTNPIISVQFIVISRPASFFFIANSCFAFVRAILKQSFYSLLSPTCQ
jgi:hypothetical protein